MHNLVRRDDSIFDWDLDQDRFLVARIRRGVPVLAVGGHVCINDEALPDAALDVDFVFPRGKGDVREAGEEHAISSYMSDDG